MCFQERAVLNKSELGTALRKFLSRIYKEIFARVVKSPGNLCNRPCTTKRPDHSPRKTKYFSNVYHYDTMEI